MVNRPRSALAKLALCVVPTLMMGCESRPTKPEPSARFEPAAAPRPEPEDLDGHALDPIGANERPDVLVFIRTDCPISNRYAPRLAKLAGRFADRPLDLWLVYVDPDEGPKEIREHIAAYSLPGTPLRDPGQVVAAKAEVRVTPEAAVFEADGTLRYHGRIDDWYVDFGKSRTEPSTAELADAITAVLEGGEIALAQTKAVGCPLPPLPDEAMTKAEPKPELKPATTTIDARAIVAAPDRDEADRETDRRREPIELLEFLALEPGMKVAEIGAGTGYTTELLARALGPSGVVYGQNPPFVLERFARAGWDARLAKPVNATVVSLEREFDDPFPADIEALDLVINVLFYHDFEWQEVDRAAHNADVFAALRPGGRYVIIDASAAAGRGAADSKTLHRIEQSLVVAELEAAGFRLAAEADFLRSPDDNRDWNALPWSDPARAERGEFSDKFVLAFEKSK